MREAETIRRPPAWQGWPRGVFKIGNNFGLNIGLRVAPAHPPNPRIPRVSHRPKPLKTPPRRSKMRPRRPKMRPRRAKTAPRRPQDASKTAQDASQTAQDASKTALEASQIRFLVRFGRLHGDNLAPKSYPELFCGEIGLKAQNYYFCNTRAPFHVFQ